jgi:hypothetical protein
VEKREYARHQIWFPVTVEAEHKKLLAVCRDASPGGLMISSAATIEVGAKVKATFRVTPESKEHVIAGSILRIETNRDDPQGMWPHRIAIEFDAVVADIEPILQQRGSQSPPPK